MKVAVAYDNGQIHEHFGHCPCFAVYEYGGTTADCTKTLVDTSAAQGHAAMAELMQAQGVEAVLSGNMGTEAVSLLLSLGILPVYGFCGDADTAAGMLVTGQLMMSGEGGGCGGGCSGGCCGGCGSDSHDQEGGCGCGGGCH